MMREHQFRHLPVQDGGKLVGVLTDRDVKLAASFAESNKLTVEDVMTPDPYTTTPHASLQDVVLEMAEHKYGCAIVKQENGKVVGIFTATDGLRVLGEILEQNYRAMSN
jgi:acetoin utilization protein AcuB